MQSVQCPDALDRGDRPAVIGSRKRETGLDPASVRQHGARSTCSHVTAFFGAGHAKLVPENIQERVATWRADLVIPTVYLERNMDGRTRRHEVSLKVLCRSLIKSSSPRWSEVRLSWQGERRSILPRIPQSSQIARAPEGLVLS